MNSSDPAGGTGPDVVIDGFFAGHDGARRLFDTLRGVMEALGGYELRVGKSQVVFRRRRGFAWVWIPARYLCGKVAPLVLSVALSRREPSPRWKEVVEPRRGRFMHHLELREAADIDDQVAAWLREAWLAAG